ncbi:Translocation protein SEC62 [Eumeta japonica]|uniref:Translocation protein SEC62 n=1 Tax=Eumeta variegata TaxID=151549 RepID=A0A4C1XHB6_EUMVA|nr:Translocation protein SEC62 [Eumeta japonica]
MRPHVRDFGEQTESEKPTSEEYAVAKWLKSNVPTKKTKFLNHHVEYFTGTKAVDALLTSNGPQVKSHIHNSTRCHQFSTSNASAQTLHRAKKYLNRNLKGNQKERARERSKSGDEREAEKSQASLAKARKGVYYLSVAAAAFLVMIIALAVLRLVVFCTVWILTLSRHHLWLLPNLTEDVGFFASFWPLYKYEYRGPSSDNDKSKNKKRRKKDKVSDDEADERGSLMSSEKEEHKQGFQESEEPLIKHPPQETSSLPTPETIETDLKDERPDKTASQKEETQLTGGSSEKHSESESENSQRSSTDREFEMVESADLDPETEVEPDKRPQHDLP